MSKLLVGLLVAVAASFLMFVGGAGAAPGDITNAKGTGVGWGQPTVTVEAQQFAWYYPDVQPIVIPTAETAVAPWNLDMGIEVGGFQTYLQPEGTDEYEVVVETDSGMQKKAAIITLSVTFDTSPSKTYRVTWSLKMDDAPLDWQGLLYARLLPPPGHSGSYSSNAAQAWVLPFVDNVANFKNDRSNWDDLGAWYDDIWNDQKVVSVQDAHTGSWVGHFDHPSGAGGSCQAFAYMGFAHEHFAKYLWTDSGNGVSDISSHTYSLTSLGWKFKVEVTELP